MSYRKEIVAGVIGLSLALLGGSSALAQSTCGSVSRSQVEADIAAGLSGDQIYSKYCSAVTTSVAVEDGDLGGIWEETNQPAQSGSTFWESIQSCGYHPQREEAVCALNITQTGGYGGRICVAPGSTEYVLLCVNFGAGLVPVNIGTVHVHDAPAGAVPPWDFGVVIQANPRLATLPNNGATLPARAILSWGILPPQNCNWVPVWGNAVNFRIRLDP